MYKIIPQLYDYLFYKNVMFTKANVEVWNAFFKNFKGKNSLLNLFYYRIF